VSPRKRAQRTFELLNLGFKGLLPWQVHGDKDGDGLESDARVQVTEDIREWDYGDYEGITSAEIRKMRADQGIEGYWDIWKDGCPGGECVFLSSGTLIPFRSRRANLPPAGVPKT
jgi:sedoheptulose-bisphosphatase